MDEDRDCAERLLGGVEELAGRRRFGEISRNESRAQFERQRLPRFCRDIAQHAADAFASWSSAEASARRR